MFGIASDDSIWHTWPTTPGGGWNGGWEQIDGPADRLRSLASAANQDGRLERRRRADLAADPPSAPTGELCYRLATEVPENWYPLLPKQTGLRAIEYQLGEAHLGPNPTPTPLGSVPGGNIPLSIQEEQLYRPGLRVRRLARRVHWSDGSVRVWLGRRTGPGRGESRSGLRFDPADGSVAGDRQA